MDNISSLINNIFSYTLVTTPLELAVADSGCTGHFLPTTCPCNVKVPVISGGKRMRMTNGETMVATHTSLIPLPQPPIAARKCDVIPDLQQPLLFIGQLYYAGFTSTLDSEIIQLTKDIIATMLGMRDQNNGLCAIPIQGSLSH